MKEELTGQEWAFASAYGCRETVDDGLYVRYLYQHYQRSLLELKDKGVGVFDIYPIKPQDVYVLVCLFVPKRLT